MKIAVLDLYKRTSNQGMRGILSLLEAFKAKSPFLVEIQIFEVRSKGELPDLEYDVYISSGGPGDPHFQEEASEEMGMTKDWGVRWNHLMLAIMDYNLKSLDKKSVFLICHSFQMMCILLKVASVELRFSTSFGIFPMHKTPLGSEEEIFLGLSDPFYAVDSRDYQVLDPNHEKILSHGMKILAYEKIRPHVPFDRAIMAIRFSEDIIGTQFHPEADPESMRHYFNTPEKKATVIKEHGIEKYEDMVASINNPVRIKKTFEQLIPCFLEKSMKRMKIEKMQL